MSKIEFFESPNLLIIYNLNFHFGSSISIFLFLAQKQYHSHATFMVLSATEITKGGLYDVVDKNTKKLHFPTVNS